MAITNSIVSGKLNPAAEAPLYLQLAARLAEQIGEGQLPAGTKLPPERELALLFEVSRTTAINAYRHLEQEGLVVSKVGSGTYVAASSNLPPKNIAMPWEQLFVPQIKTPMASILRDLVHTPTANSTISLAAGMSDPAYYPLERFDALLSGCFKAMDPAHLGHIPTEGYTPLREVIAAREQARGIPASMHNLLILSGAQQGLYLITRAFVEPGDYVIVEAPTYIGAIQVFQGTGARILSLPVREEFPLDLLEDFLARYRPKLFYTVSNFQNPTGRVLSPSDRIELLRLAAQYRMMIIEDDPYGELYYDTPPPPPLKALDEQGCVLYLGTLSKVLFPGLRTGWLIGPPVVINRLAQEKQYIDLHCNNLTQWLLAQYLQSGDLDLHIGKVRALYGQRRDAMADAIRRFGSGAIDFTLPGGGFYLWCQLRGQLTTRAVVHEAAKAGVTLVPGEAFYPGRLGTHEFRLCFATHEEAILVEGIKRLTRIINNLPPAGPREEDFDLGPPII